MYVSAARINKKNNQDQKYPQWVFHPTDNIFKEFFNLGGTKPTQLFKKFDPKYCPNQVAEGRKVANFRPSATWLGQYLTAIFVNFQYLEGPVGMASRDFAADFLHLAIF